MPLSVPLYHTVVMVNDWVWTGGDVLIYYWHSAVFVRCVTLYDRDAQVKTLRGTRLTFRQSTDGSTVLKSELVPVIPCLTFPVIPGVNLSKSSVWFGTSSEALLVNLIVRDLIYSPTEDPRSRHNRGHPGIRFTASLHRGGFVSGPRRFQVMTAIRPRYAPGCIPSLRPVVVLRHNRAPNAARRSPAEPSRVEPPAGLRRATRRRLSNCCQRRKLKCATAHKMSL